MCDYLQTERPSSVNSLDMVIEGGYAGLQHHVRKLRVVSSSCRVRYRRLSGAASSPPSTLSWCKGGSGSKRDINSRDLNALVWGFGVVLRFILFPFTLLYTRSDGAYYCSRNPRVVKRAVQALTTRMKPSPD